MDNKWKDAMALVDKIWKKQMICSLCKVWGSCGCECDLVVKVSKGNARN